jgi:hypothetical protein
MNERLFRPFPRGRQSGRSALASALRIARALFISQYALMLEFRAEILLWALSGVMPLLMFSLWSSAPAGAAAGISPQAFARYFLAAFVVRQFTVVWVVYAFEEDNLLGRLSPLLLQPLPLVWRYAAAHLADKVAFHRELADGGHDRVARQPQVLRQVAGGRQALARAQLAVELHRDEPGEGTGVQVTGPFVGQVVLDGNDVISLRERIHLLKARSVVDYSRNYHRVDFREGTLQLRTIGGGLELSEVKLKADDLFTLEGAMTVRLPSQKEIEEAIVRGEGFSGSVLADVADEAFLSKGLAQKNEAEITLRRAAQALDRSGRGGVRDESGSLFDRLSSNAELRKLQQQASERISRMLRYEGSLSITIPSDAFERASRLQLEYPLDASIGRVPIIVPVQGYLYDVTLKQAEDIYEWRNN